MNYIITLLLLLTFSLSAQAQEFRNDISISAQLREGSAPGLQYQGEQSTAAAKPVNEKERTGYKMVHNEMEGVHYKKDASLVAQPVSAPKSAAYAETLSSDMPAEPVQTAPVQPVPIPSQDNTQHHELTSGQ